MILRQYISDVITNILAVTFLLVALLSFGFSEFFDRLFIVFLLGLLLLNHKNANIISIVMIFLLERFLEEIIFFLSTYPIVKFFIYALSLFFIRVLWYDKAVKKLVLPTILICLMCEVYWYIELYNAPRIHSYIAMLILNMVTRHLIFMRVPTFRKYQSLPLFEKHISIQLKQISLDWQLYSLALINGIVVIAILAEYLIRHLTNFSPMIVYDYYRYAMQLLSVTTLFFITNFIIKSDHKIKA